MLDFEKEKMVKVVALKNLSNVLKMRAENQQQELSAREQKDGPETSTPLQRRWHHPVRFSTGSLWHTASAQPLQTTLGLSNQWLLCFQSGDCGIPWPSQQTCKGETPNPPCAPTFAILRKQVMVWSQNMLLLNFTVRVDGGNNIKANSSALWRV